MSQEMMIPCDHVIAKLWEYLDGDLDELRSEKVRSHLDACARCFPEYDFRRAYLSFIRRSSTQEMPPEVRRRIFAAILESEARNGGGAALRRSNGALARAGDALRRIMRRD